MVDDISGTGSPVRAIGGRVIGEGGSTGGGRATGRREAGAEEAEHDRRG